jgi:hypothetical protein
MRWDEVTTVLRDRGLLAVENRRWLGLVWRFGAETQRQRVEVARRSSRDDHIVVASEVMPIVQLSPLAVLRHNARSLLGSMAAEGPMCVLRSVLRLDDLTAPLLLRTAVACAHEAARLRGLRRAAAGPTPYVVD